jgi:hypothetical protein
MGLALVLAVSAILNEDISQKPLLGTIRKEEIQAIGRFNCHWQLGFGNIFFQKSIVSENSSYGWWVRKQGLTVWYHAKKIGSDVKY